ncbi:MAG: 50S ribosomal protein L29 [Candidatus Aenigmarchaeota archaeon]|nr:50S ribosomal protein L29 [Candidatus Aenigmarchaeota archaeon]
MAIIKKPKMREMNDSELTEKLRELRLEISKEIAASEVGGTVKNSGRIKESKKTIARILTIQHQKKFKGG